MFQFYIRRVTELKLRRSTYHVQVADMLRDLIMTGKLKEGDKVNEAGLCDTMGISKTPLREALRVLSVEGLIELVPNRGAFVTQPMLDEITEMFDVMELLEGFCARSACEKLDDTSFARLEKLHLELEKYYRLCNQAEYVRINNQYHTFLQELAGNRALNQIVTGLRKKILLYRFQSLNQPHRFEESIREHRHLIEAFRKREPEKAEALMQMHMKNQCQAMVSLAQKAKSGPVSLAASAKS